jgi:antibiotic biosynthesis monooxygenase (ABM) superfamily enzyme
MTARADRATLGHPRRTPAAGGSRGAVMVRTTPPRYRLVLLTWAAAYSVITPIVAVLGPAVGSWPLPLRTLLFSALMVQAMTWVVIPLLTRLFRSWL